MKKSKPLSLHHIQSNSPSNINKKKPPLSIKSKITKSPASKKQTLTFKHSQPEDYIIINDNIYSANTFTQRNCYDQFLTKVKKQKQQQRKSFLFKQTLDDSQLGKLKKTKQNTKKKFKKLSPQDLIKGMSLNEKREMFFKLQQEIKQTNKANILPELPFLAENNKQSQPCSTQSFQHDLSQRMRIDSQRQRQQKFHQLQEKLETLKMQLLFKWQAQLQKLQQFYRKGKISEKEKQNKIIIIEKLKDHKLKVIECTRTLFQKILQQNANDNELNEKKNDKIQAILQSLHSLPSLESLKDQEIQKQPNIDHLKVVNNQKIKNEQNNECSKFVKSQHSDLGSTQVKNEKNLTSFENLTDIKQEKFQQNLFINKNTSQQNNTLEIVEDKNHEVFLSQLNQDIHKKKMKTSQQDFVSPLGFKNEQSPNKGRFAHFQEVNTIVNTGFNVIPTKSEEMLRQLLEMGDKSKESKTSFSIFSMQSQEQQNKLSLKLDLRLDEVVFGQDDYPQCQKEEHSKSNLDKYDSYPDKSQQQNNSFNNLNQINQSLNLKFEEKIVRGSPKSNKKRSLIQFTSQKAQEDNHIQKQRTQQDTKNVQKIILHLPQQKHEDFKDQLKENIQKISLAKLQSNSKVQSQKTNQQLFKLPLDVNPDKEQTQSTTQKPSQITKSQITQQFQTVQDQSLKLLECHEVSHTVKHTIDIPMILSQQKMETLALEQNRLFRQNLDRRIAFQMGCIEIEPSEPSSPHFTTLVDINSYIVGLYQFMMKKYMSSLVDSLNIPYGKSAVDKLYSLHNEGFVLEETYNQMNNILSESQFVQYQRQMTLTVRKCSQYESTHNRAVFEAFTKAINVYRPYYELEGEVFPWIVSEKGITFYEITEDNIEEVFEKSKIKVLQYCTSLCGIHPPTQVKNDEQSTIVNNKNQQNLNKIIKTQTLQQFEEWKIRFVNFDCLVRLLVGKIIFSDIISEATQEIVKITRFSE